MSRALILLAEDDPATRRLYSDVLRAKSYQVVCAINGVEAVQLVDRTTPDLILLDIMMPDLDGIGACKQLRPIVGHETPIVFLSALNEVATVRKALEAGGDDFVIKSGDLRSVLERVAFWTNKRTAAEARERRKAALDSTSGGGRTFAS
jgi:DNA-binding response OmpR family regulator